MRVIQAPAEERSFMSSRIPARASSRRRSARAAVRVILLSLVVMAGTTAPTLAQAPAEKAPAGPTGGGAKARIQLLELRDVEVQTAADLIAAETGHLEVMKYLGKLRAKNTPTSAAARRARAGRLPRDRRVGGRRRGGAAADRLVRRALR